MRLLTTPYRSLFGTLPKAALMVAVLGGALGTARAATYDVTVDYWGTAGDVGSFAWAVAQANSNFGHDTIRVQANLQINADVGEKVGSNGTWLAIFTESVTIEGNNATLVANPSYVTSGGLIATKTNIVGSAYDPPIQPSDVVVVPGVSFAQIGVLGQDNSHVEVVINNLNADGVGSVATVNEKASLTVLGGSFRNIVNYTGENGRAAFESRAGATLNLDRISLSRNFPFGKVIPVGDVALFSGSIAGLDSTLNMQNSTISNSFGAGAIAWSGGTANVVSSILSNSGGLQISDSLDNEGTLNLINSILFFQGGETLQQTNRIVATSGGIANVTASTVLYNSLYTTGSSVPYDGNGMPLTATLGGTLRFNSSAVLPLNWDEFWGIKKSYAEFSGGDLKSDDFSFIAATAVQDRTALQSLFDNSSFFTEGGSFPVIDLGVDLFKALPQGAVPLTTSSLINAVPNADGTNQLLNPIDGTVINVDVFGYARTSDGKRNIGAVQTSTLPPGPPQLIGITDPNVLWPPNHKMAAVRVALAAIDDETPLAALLETLSVTISSNEPDSRGKGDPAGDVNGRDGFTAPVDVTGAFKLNASTGRIEGTVDLRAERFGERSGRTYTLEAEVTDGAGNKGTVVLEIKVPHDRR
jgi:hypothetical protein